MQMNLPPMGWNTWNTYGEKISEDVVRSAADQLVKLGLRDAGYRYVVIDDCWSERERDPESGRLVPDRKKFPSGIRALADYIHGLGLKFGMYSCAGVRTCAFYPGSFDHEFPDAETFAEFGCDYLKYDYCNCPEGTDGKLLYRRMGHALRFCGREIVYSVCNWGRDDVWSWARSAGANLYRSTGDISDNFASFRKNAESQFSKFCFSGPHCFNDLDMLTVGMFGKGNVGIGGCDMNQYRTQFALWCVMGAPLMLGCDLHAVTPEVLQLVSNAELIAFDQDPEARGAFPANPKETEVGRPILVKLLADGDLAIGFFNLTEEKGWMTFLAENIGFSASSGCVLRMREVFSGEEITVGESFGLTMEPCSCKVFRAHPVRR